MAFNSVEGRVLLSTEFDKKGIEDAKSSIREVKDEAEKTGKSTTDQFKDVDKTLKMIGEASRQRALEQQKQIKETGREVKKFGDEGKTAMLSLARGAAELGGEFLSVGAAMEFLVATMAEFRDHQRIVSTTTQMIKNFGLSGSESIKGLTDTAHSLSAAFGETSDNILEAEKALLSTSAITNQSNRRLTELAVNMAAAVGDKPQEEALKLADALTTAGGAMGAMKAAGHNVTIYERQMLSDWEKFGAYGAIADYALRVLENAYRDQAKAVNEASYGTNHLYNAFIDLRTTIGQGFNPGWQKGLDHLGELVDDITSGIQELEDSWTEWEAELQKPLDWAAAHNLPDELKKAWNASTAAVNAYLSARDKSYGAEGAEGAGGGAGGGGGGGWGGDDSEFGPTGQRGLDRGSLTAADLQALMLHHLDIGTPGGPRDRRNFHPRLSSSAREQLEAWPSWREMISQSDAPSERGRRGLDRPQELSQGVRDFKEETRGATKELDTFTRILHFFNLQYDGVEGAGGGAGGGGGGGWGGGGSDIAPSGPGPGAGPGSETYPGTSRPSGGPARGGAKREPFVSDAPMTAAERRNLGLILEYESHGANVMNYAGRQQGLDPTTAKGYTAQGYYQMLNSNWRRLAPQLGIKERNAMAASFRDQTRVALALMRESGIGNWANYNPALRAALRRGENPPSQFSVYDQSPAAQAASLSSPAATAARLRNERRQDQQTMQLGKGEVAVKLQLDSNLRAGKPAVTPANNFDLTLAVDRTGAAFARPGDPTYAGAPQL